MRGLEALTRRSPETEDVVEHSLYRTRGGAYVAVFGEAESGPNGLKPGFEAMFLNRGTSRSEVSPGARMRYRPNGKFGLYGPLAESHDEHELDLFERIGYRVD